MGDWFRAGCGSDLFLNIGGRRLRIPKGNVGGEATEGPKTYQAKQVPKLLEAD